MARVCTVCGKGPVTGNNVSHAKNRTNRRWYPNLQTVRVLKDGEHGLVSVGDGETYVIPAEVCEQRYGIRVERFAFDVVEAGAGRRRPSRPP